MALRGSDDSTDSLDRLDPSHHFSSSCIMLVSRRLARRLGRCCCLGVQYIPLAFVYGLSTWAVYVMVQLGRRPSARHHGSHGQTEEEDAAAVVAGPACAVAAVVLYVLLVWSYTAAVWTPPGATSDTGYRVLLGSEDYDLDYDHDHDHDHDHDASSVSAHPPALLTVKSNGQLRFCKKCQARKPDRAHHCSTCGRCVLKMDHHCPWLATCIGLHNYKAFVLFLVYTTLFALLCCAATAAWVWVEVAGAATYTSYDDSMLPIQYILLCVLSGIIGLVVGLFTCWHLWLACHGQTTIECMEKTRYQSPLRDEEMGLGGGRALPMDASAPGRFTFDQLARYRAQKRHQAALDEQDSAQLPHAFDLGLRRNLLHLLGPRPWLWALPVCNTTGDGWSWEPSPRWLAAHERIRRARAEQQARERAAGWGPVEEEGDGESSSEEEDEDDPLYRPSHRPDNRPLSKADRILGRDPRLYDDHPVPSVPLQRLHPTGRTLRPPLDDTILDELAAEDAAADAADEARERAKDEAAAQQRRAPTTTTTTTTTRSLSPLAPLSPLSPLHARWLSAPAPAGASGLLHKAAVAAQGAANAAAHATMQAAATAVAAAATFPSAPGSPRSSAADDEVD